MPSRKRFKTTLTWALSCLLVSSLLLLAACASSVDEEDAYGDDALTEIPTEVSTLPDLKIAALQSDDLLPMRVAQTEELFEVRGLSVEIVLFDTVTEKHDALAAAEVDGLVTDMADLALMRANDIEVRAVGVIQNISNLRPDTTDTAGGVMGAARATDEDPALDADISSEETITLHQTLFEVPDGLIDQRALAVSHDFLLGNLASGETTAPEASAEAVAALIGAIAQAVGQVNAVSDEYNQLYLEQALAEHDFSDVPEMPHYPFPDLPDREQGEALLRWMYSEGVIPEEIGYDELIFIPSAP